VNGRETRSDGAYGTAGGRGLGVLCIGRRGGLRLGFEFIRLNGMHGRRVAGGEGFLQGLIEPIIKIRCGVHER
jgi:hypothetical protein